jgi:hypothetical protein
MTRPRLQHARLDDGLGSRQRVRGECRYNLCYHAQEKCLRCAQRLLVHILQQPQPQLLEHRVCDGGIDAQDQRRMEAFEKTLYTGLCMYFSYDLGQ